MHRFAFVAVASATFALWLGACSTPLCPRNQIQHGTVCSHCPEGSEKKGNQCFTLDGGVLIDPVEVENDEAEDRADAGVTSADGPTSMDANTANLDGTMANSVTTDAAGPSASGEAGPAREYSLGRAGAACPAELEQSLACEGHASAKVLKCQGGSWQVLQNCSTSERCDSRVGTEQGTCASIPAACVGKGAGEICDGLARLECGIDLVTVNERPCGEHLRCDSNPTTHCACDPGYQDDGHGGCSNPDDCPAGACSGGKCVDGLSDYSCNCNSGFAGTGTRKCTAVLYCPKDACTPGGTCVDTMNWSCQCTSGYIGTGTQACTNQNDCPTNRCLAPNGSCQDQVGTYKCTCNAGFSGTDCVNDICVPNPCKNGGTCSRTGTLCTCAAGFSGTSCQTDVCNPNPCLNGGTCSRTGTRCACPAGFSGANCQTDVCTPNPCANGGSCNRSGTLCSCPSGFSGPACQTNACSPNPCSPGGSCTGTATGYRCTCTPGYTGTDSTRCDPGVGKIAASASASHACAIRNDNSVVCWGSNSDHQLSTDSSASLAPFPVFGFFAATQLAVGGAITCARLRDSTVSCFGTNTAGQLGNGTTSTAFSSASPVGGLPGVVKVAATFGTVCALLNDRTVRCWGDNSMGQVGNGSFDGPVTVPTAVSNLGDVVDIDAGVFHFCAVRDDTSKTAVCWGDGDYGQLGGGTTVNASNVPVQVVNLTGASRVAVGGSHSCALKTDGTVVCWGRNGVGTLGNGTLQNSLTPVAVSNLQGVTAVAAGAFHTCAANGSGQVRCWGLNQSGALGTGALGDSTVPALTVGLPAIDVIAAGTEFSCARATDSRAFCWGTNQLGELGGGATGNSFTAVAVRNWY